MVSPVCAFEILIEYIVFDKPVECVQYVFDVDVNTVWFAISVFPYNLPYVDVIAGAG